MNVDIDAVNRLRNEDVPITNWTNEISVMRSRKTIKAKNAELKLEISHPKYHRSKRI